MTDNRRHRPEDDKEPPSTAADEILHEAEEAETRVLDGGERPGKDGEAADALTPDERAQEDVSRHDD
ncbi:hypothetical protein DSC45_05045 [Streptomyces sp. YIM 130001]|uniref:hypothetical protein n=1 Tax=Streptomyces sp. YIM 130001 TaxID=2259644 RepID=UPI000E659994|nr:hypothetical protein [Streptomyces sp. YIM 130001]RII20574.1 hypothetical protein DSC45_05045 [Streptomyces sp. YIM 130001]